MLIQLLLALVLGIFAGTLTGLTPGIHINLIGAILISLTASVFYKIPTEYLIVFISAMAIAHTFLDFIPSVLLGCPDTDTGLSVLPGHELLQKGLGYQAIQLANLGSISAIIILTIIAIPSIILLPKIELLIETLIPYLLIIAILFLIFSDSKKLSAILVILLTGILGWSVLNSDLIKEPLLPLLGGLFGGSNLILSIKNKITIPPQKIIKLKILKRNLIKPIIGATLASPLCSFLPGLGSGQAAVIGNTVARTKKRGFLFLLGATNTLVMGFSFLTLYSIQKTRTGAANTILQLSSTISKQELSLIIITIIISGIVSFYLTDFIAKFASLKITKFNYSKASAITLGILGIISLLISGFFGFVVLIISTALGVFCILTKAKRTNMMACLMIPVILIYLGI